MFRRVLGGGDTEVVDVPWVPRSRSRETTFPADLTERSEMNARLGELAAELVASVAADGRIIVRVAVKVRSASFFTRTRIVTLREPTTVAADVQRAALSLLDRFDLTRPVRLLGVRVEFAPLSPVD